MLRPFDRFNDLAESRFLTQVFGENLKRAGLVNGASIDSAASYLFAGHRFTCNGRFLHKGVTADDLAIYGNPAAGTNKNNLSREDRIRGHFKSLTLPEHAGGLRKKIEHVLNGTPPAAHSESFEDFGSQHERGNDQRGKELSDSQRRSECDGHRKLHRHPAFDDILECLLEDRITADQGGRQSYYADAMKRLPQVEPNRCCRERYEDDTENLHD